MRVLPPDAMLYAVSGPLLGQIKAGAKVVEAVTDGHTAWVLTKTTLERWRLTPNGSAERIALGALPARGRALAVSGAQVLIGTDAGVHAARVLGASLQISQPAELCGRPLRAASVSGSLWAVATTLGVAMVSTGAEGAPVVLSVSGVIPDPGGAGWLVPLPQQMPGLATCRHLDRAFGEPLMEAMSRTSAMAATGRRVLAARGPFVVELDVTEAQAPVLVQSEAVHTLLESLRVDELGERAYGVARGIPCYRHPVLDLRGGGLTLVGQHDVSDWVERADKGELSLRLANGKKVELARVVR